MTLKLYAGSLKNYIGNVKSRKRLEKVIKIKINLILLCLHSSWAVLAWRAVLVVSKKSLGYIDVGLGLRLKFSLLKCEKDMVHLMSRWKLLSFYFNESDSFLVVMWVEVLCCRSRWRKPAQNQTGDQEGFSGRCIACDVMFLSSARSSRSQLPMGSTQRNTSL